MSISRTEAGREVTPAQGGITGDFGGAAGYIVPHYHETGHKTRQGMPISSDATSRMERILSREGTKQLPTPPASTKPITKAAKKKAQKQQEWAAEQQRTNIPLPPYAINAPPALSPTLTTKPIMVAFHLPSGKLKILVDAVLETDMGIALVFANEDEVRFTPEQGNELTLTLPNKQDVKVMYLGITFSWYNSAQKIMTFIKS